MSEVIDLLKQLSDKLAHPRFQPRYFYLIQAFNTLFRRYNKALIPLHITDRSPLQLCKKTPETEHCLICFEPYNEEELLVCLPCCKDKHMHINCMSHCLAQKASCPFCRHSRIGY